MIKLQRRRFLHVLGATGLAGSAAAGCGDQFQESRDPSGGGQGGTGGTSSTGEGGSSTLPEPDHPATTAVFAHGVASGDPFKDSVMLWTRVTVDALDDLDPTGVVEVTWLVAVDPMMESVVTDGRALTSGDRDHCVTVEAADLEADTTYYYRFDVAGVPSMVGRTKTAPKDARPLKFAVCSCSSLAHGYFHAYRRIADRDDLDAVIHLGDYIYEYATGDYGDVRAYDPPHEILTRNDYRRRYKQYRSDPDLQEVHRRHPFITVWDDHESANNAWTGGAQNHTASYEGPWSARKSVAQDTYFEYMPVRDFGDKDRVHRYLRYGDVAELIMLDTRMHGRDKQAWGENDDSLWDHDRQLLGADQESFLQWRLEDSKARWKIIGQQVMMAPRPHQYSISTDAWEGYPRQRNRIFDMFEATGNVVVLTGDVHSSWGNDLNRDPGDPNDYNPDTGAGSIAVELVTPAVSSSPWKPEQAAKTYDKIADQSPHVRYVELTKNGYMLLDIDESRVQARWMYLDDVTDQMGDGEQMGAQVEVLNGERFLRPM